MRVRCIRTLCGSSGRFYVEGETYTVSDGTTNYAIYAGNNMRPYYNVVDDCGGVSGIWAEFFEVVNDVLPNGWRYCKCGTTTSNPGFMLRL